MARTRVKSSIGNVAKKEVRQMVRGAIKGMQEHKVVAVANAAANSATGGTVVPITQWITQGDDLNNRSGDVVLIEKLHFYLTLSHYIGAAYTPCAQRVIVFSDTMNDGTLPGVTDVLEAAAFNSGYAQGNYQRMRYKIYMDKFFDQVSQTNTAIKSISEDIRIGKKIYYKGGAFATASNGKHALFFLIISSTASAGNTTYASGWTLKYTDS
jgi:hypothetical protein